MKERGLTLPTSPVSIFNAKSPLFQPFIGFSGLYLIGYPYLFTAAFCLPPCPLQIAAKAWVVWKFNSRNSPTQAASMQCAFGS